jgi:hypothetical protein
MAITTPPMGIGEAFGIGLETTFGTLRAPNIWWRPISNTLMRRDPVLPLSGPTGSVVDLTTTRGFRGLPDISGTVVVEAEYDDIGFILANAIATPTFGNDTPVPDTFTHTFTMAAGVPTSTPVSFSAARATDSSDFDTQFTGCMINAIEISGASGRIVTVSMDIVGQQGGAAHTDDTIGTLSTAPFIEFHDSVIRADLTATGQTLNSGDDENAGAEAVDWVWRLDNNYRRAQAAGNGVRGDREYTFAGYRTSTITFNRDFWDDNYFDEYHDSTLANTFGTIAVYCESDEFVTGSTPYSLNIQFNAGQVTGHDQPYNGGPDILNENVVVKAGYNGSDAPLVVALVNGTEDLGTNPYKYVAP